MMPAAVAVMVAFPNACPISGCLVRPRQRGRGARQAVGRRCGPDHDGRRPADRPRRHRGGAPGGPSGAGAAAARGAVAGAAAARRRRRGDGRPRTCLYLYKYGAAGGPAGDHGQQAAGRRAGSVARLSRAASLRGLGRRRGLVIKLIAAATTHDRAGIQADVRPRLVPIDSPMAQVDGAMNAIAVDAEYAGLLLFEGPGAGPDAAASAVLADLIRAAKDVPPSAGSLP